MAAGVTEDNGDEHFEQILTDTMVMDASIVSVLQNTRLRGDEKWFHYYKCLEQYLYKRHPTFKPIQFTLKVQEDCSSNGSSDDDDRVTTYVIVPGDQNTAEEAQQQQRKKKKKRNRLLQFAPGILGSVLGASLAGFIRLYFDVAAAASTNTVQS